MNPKIYVEGHTYHLRLIMAGVNGLLSIPCAVSKHTGAQLNQCVRFIISLCVVQKRSLGHEWDKSGPWTWALTFFPSRARLLPWFSPSLLPLGVVGSAIITTPSNPWWIILFTPEIGVTYHIHRINSYGASKYITLISWKHLGGKGIKKMPEIIFS